MQKIRKIPCKNLVEFYFLIWIHSIQGWTATTRDGVTRKRIKDEHHSYKQGT